MQRVVGVQSHCATLAISRSACSSKISAQGCKLVGEVSLPAYLHPPGISPRARAAPPPPRCSARSCRSTLHHQSSRPRRSPRGGPFGRGLAGSLKSELRACRGHAAGLTASCRRDQFGRSVGGCFSAIQGCRRRDSSAEPSLYLRPSSLKTPEYFNWATFQFLDAGVPIRRSAPQARRCAAPGLDDQVDQHGGAGVHRACGHGLRRRRGRRVEALAPGEPLRCRGVAPSCSFVNAPSPITSSCHPLKLKRRPSTA